MCLGLSPLLKLLLFVAANVLPFSRAASCPDDRACYPPSPDLVIQGSGRSISASSTCGDPPTTALVLLTEDEEVCNASSPELSHPVEALYDYRTRSPGFDFIDIIPILGTWWQSENDVRNVVLTALLGDTFLFQTTQLIFRSLRPSSLIIEKTEDSGETWTPLRFYARSCPRSFPGVAHMTVDSLDTGGDNIVSGCLERYFYGDSSTFNSMGTLQEVLYNPVLELGNSYYREQVLNHFRFTGLRITLVEPGSSVSGRDHFAVADWSITGHCLCYGHAGRCLGENGAECDCEHNTMGKHCDQCLPLYNNRPWAAARLGNAKKCQDCGCNGRAVACTYDEVEGHGVCENCTENSSGDKCERCIQDYFINPGEEQSSDYCIACNCSLVGTIPDSVCNETSGQCVCKTNVQGRHCDECMDSYYDLRQDKINGCEMCNCDSSGTSGSPNFCDKLTGQCICKTFVHGSRCDGCQPGYFNLTVINPAGCAPCDCDAGGAVNSSCNSDTGRCDCKANIGGTNCQTADEGFFVPLLDGIRIEAESILEPPDSDTAGCDSTSNIGPFMNSLEICPWCPLANKEVEALGAAIGGSDGDGDSQQGSDQLLVMPSMALAYPTLVVPRTQRYEVVIRYRATSVWSSNELSLLSPDNETTYNCVDTEEMSQPETLVFNLSASESLAAAIVGVVCLAADVDYEPVFTTSSQAEDVLALDAIVFLPVLEDVPLYLQSGNSSSQIILCWEEAAYHVGGVRNTANCSSIEYSIMAEMYDGAIECDCDINGSSNSSQCDPLGGQCECLPGVTGRRCQYCAAYHYDYQPGIGCQACGCHLLGSVVESCNHTTGACQCKTNVVGTKCSECAPDHYGLMEGMGCLLCTCDGLYSLSNSCNDTGSCNCKPGVGGITCGDGCLDGFFNLTSDGCEPCLCDQIGSRGISCSQDSGQCDCLESAEGLKCDTCAPNSYGFGPYSERGCLECLCSGHSSNCSEAPGWFMYDIVSRWPLFTFQANPEWTGQAGPGDSVRVNTRPILEVMNPRFILELEDPGTDVDLFFVSPGVYGGDRRTAYGQMLSFTLSQSKESNQTVSPDGDVLLYGLYSDQPLVAQLPEAPGVEAAEYQVRLHEDYWLVGNMSGERPDMIYMVQVLSALESIKIRAKFTELPSESVFLHEAVLSLASDDRTESSGDPASFVESCTCPEQYTGQFCELCSEGYRWDDPAMGSFSECTPCNCHNHSPTPCDIRAGVCAGCIHNTVGDYCERCQDGYYGDATLGTPEDCQPCMCPGPAGANSFAATCDQQGVCQQCTGGHGGPFCEYCLPGFFGVPTDPENNGGRCEECRCNLSPPMCNSTTGYCTNCTGDTAGASCEQCRFGFFGTIDNCTACDCSTTGSYGNCTADGVCDCLPNVNGTKCTSCVVDSWGFQSGAGCTLCDCHPVGTVSGQTHCDLETGQCECKTGITGLRCDQCMDGYWDVSQECIPCDCDVNGTDAANCTDGLCSCDQVTGQCQCSMQTIGGRRCDRCGGMDEDMAGVADVFVDHFPNCEPCPECFHNWREILNDQIEQLDLISIYITETLASYGNVSLASFDEQLRGINETLLSARTVLDRGQEQTATLYAVQAYSQEVSDKISSVESSLGSVQSQQLDLRAAVNQLKDLDGNVSITGDVITVTPDQIQESVLLINDTLDTIYRTANQSWVNIQEYYSMSVTAKMSTRALIEEIEGDLENDLERSIAQRGAAMAIQNDEDIARERDQNAARIVESRRVQQGYDLENIALDVISAGDTAEEALGYSVGASNAADVEAEEARAVFESAGVLIRNLSQGEQMVADTHSRAQSYKDVALILQFNTTSARTMMLDVSRSLNVSAELMANSTRLTQDVQDYAVRPFPEMASLVAQINQSHLPEEEVRDLLTDSREQLSRAEVVLNATKEALNEAVAVAGYLDTTENNLAEGRGILAENSLEHLMENITRIDGITAEVHSRADRQVAQSSLLVDDISILIRLGRSTLQCFTENDFFVQNTTQKLRDSQTRLENGREVLLVASSKTTELDEAVSTLSETTSTDISRVNQLNDEIDSLEEELINVQQQQNLIDIISEYRAQKVTMETLMTKLDQMGSDLDQILTNLEGIDGGSLECND